MRTSNAIAVNEIEYHRNGVGGEGFHVIKFFCPEVKDDMIGVVFADCVEEKLVAVGDRLHTDDLRWVEVDPDEPADDNILYRERYVAQFNPRVSVFSQKLLGEGEIGFGVNSWRGDRYATQLVNAINEKNWSR